MVARVLLQCALFACLGMAACAPSGPDLVVLLPEAPGIREGSRIEYLGVDVGEVTRVAFVRDTVGPPRVALHLQLSRDSVPLRAADSIRVRNLGLFGDQALSIVPGPSNAQALSRGDTLLAATDPLPPRPELAKFLDALSGRVPDSLRADSADSGGARPRASRP